MGTVTKKELTKLFKNIDAKLKQKIDVHIIGGSSAIIGYDVIKETHDVDLDDIARVHAKSTFKISKLVEFFKNEYILVSAIGNTREKIMNLLDLISILFGDKAMEKIKMENSW